jgi:uncharacterized protein YraI
MEYKNFWDDFPWTTKLVLIVLVGMVGILSILTLMRIGDISFELPFSPANSSNIVVPTPQSSAPSVSASMDTEIRLNPGMGGEVIGTLRKNQEAQVNGVSPDGQWVLISIMQMQKSEGWVSAFTVEGKNTVEAPVVGTGTSAPSEYVPDNTAPAVTANADVDIYNGPGLEYGKIGVLLAGQSAEVIGYSSDNKFWVIKIPYVDSGQGWVNADQVTPKNTFGVQEVDSSGISPVSGTDAENSPRVQAITNVNIRSGPDLEYGKIGLLRAGEEADVVGVSADRLWWALNVPFADIGEAWVSVDYVIPQNIFDVPVLEPVPQGGELVITEPTPDEPSVTASVVVNLRSGPGTTYEIIGRLQQGQSAKALYTSSDGGWWGISVVGVQDGVAWVTSGFVQANNTDGLPVYP